MVAPVLLLLLCLSCGNNNTAKPAKHIHMYSYLALGDSYTIGEQVLAKENFPHQAVALLKERQLDFADPVIIATTGWTTDELAASIREHNIQDTFSIVTLLIGVNNQYRGRDVDNYKSELNELMHTAIGFAGGNANRVFVLSIPDWGVTPFAADRDKISIAREIDTYNTAKKAMAQEKGCHYIEITESTREHGVQEGWLAGDGLHPSAKEYAVWAQRLAEAVTAELKK